MSGIIKYKKLDGKTYYKFRAFLGYDEVTGKQVKVSKSGIRTKKEAQRLLAQLQLNFNNRSFSEYGNLTFKEIYLKWFDQYKMTVKESTYAKTDEHFILHILPEIGNTKISKLTTVQIQMAVNKWFKEKLSRYKRFYNYVNRVLTWAYKMQIINNNPADRVILPVNTKPIKTMSENYYDLSELKHFFKCLHEMDNDIAEVYFRILAFTGMRKGESLALLWTDINFETNQISISKTQSQGEHGRLLVNTPKTPTSIRTVDVDPKTILILKKWHSEQRKQLLMLGFNSLNDKQLVFSNNKNTMIVPTTPRKWLIDTINTFDLKKITVHGFRRTYATLAFEAGATIKEVQSQLGHKNYKTTMDIYTEVTSKQKKETAQKYANYVDF